MFSDVNMLLMLWNVSFMDWNFSFVTILFACKTSSIDVFFNDLLVSEESNSISGHVWLQTQLNWPNNHFGWWFSFSSSMSLFILPLAMSTDFIASLQFCRCSSMPFCICEICRASYSYSEFFLDYIYYIFLEHGSTNPAEIINVAAYDSL